MDRATPTPFGTCNLNLWTSKRSGHSAASYAWCACAADHRFVGVCPVCCSIDEEQYGSLFELLFEGMMGSFASFLVRAGHEGGGGEG